MTTSDTGSWVQLCDEPLASVPIWPGCCPTQPGRSPRGRHLHRGAAWHPNLGSEAATNCELRRRRPTSHAHSRTLWNKNNHDTRIFTTLLPRSPVFWSVQCYFHKVALLKRKRVMLVMLDLSAGSATLHGGCMLHASLLWVTTAACNFFPHEARVGQNHAASASCSFASSRIWIIT